MERIEMICQECGLIFVKQNYNQRYCCDKCRRLGNRRIARERYRQQNARTRKKRAALAEVNQKARAAGMTYGQYMAKEYGKQVKVERRKEKC